MFPDRRRVYTPLTLSLFPLSHPPRTTQRVRSLRPKGIYALVAPWQLRRTGLVDQSCSKASRNKLSRQVSRLPTSQPAKDSLFCRSLLGPRRSNFGSRRYETFSLPSSKYIPVENSNYLLNQQSLFSHSSFPSFLPPLLPSVTLHHKVAKKE